MRWRVDFTQKDILNPREGMRMQITVDEPTADEAADYARRAYGTDSVIHSVTPAGETG